MEVELAQKYQGATHNLGRFRLSFSASAEAGFDGLPQDVVAALQKPASQRSPTERKRVEQAYRSLDPELAKLDQQIAQHKAAAPNASKLIAQSVVERTTPRQTYIHLRGDFLSPGDKVSAGGAACLPPIKPRNEQLDRLDFAQWIVSQDNPLTARVTANRIWQRYFDRGIVATADDFGSQGARPTHPELLDYLASELRDHQWRLKHLHRLILNSATYRQQSARRVELETRDPENELLARQVRRRVEAEVIRDLALAVSGLLDPRVGGPSVRPPQPAEYSSITYANSAKWKVSSGGDRYRRGLYTFFQRTSPYPMLMTFDSPDSTACTATRSKSNTPLQALTVWNDQVFFETSQALGRRIVEEVTAGKDGETAVALNERRMQFAVQLCLSRSPDDAERQALIKFWGSPADALPAIAGGRRQDRRRSPSGRRRRRRPGGLGVDRPSAFES